MMKTYNLVFSKRIKKFGIEYQTFFNNNIGD